jgi:hypothetical protein
MQSAGERDQEEEDDAGANDAAGSQGDDEDMS